MYSPVPDIDDETWTDTASAEEAAVGKSLAKQQRHQQSHWPVKILTGTIWISGACFAMFALGHYVRRAIRGDWELWDLSDLHLYRPEQPLANVLMTTHMLGGSWLMLAGPIQLIPSIRRNYLSFHRWTGRVYIVASLVTATSIIFFVLLYRTSRRDIYEDVGNVLLGCAMLVCAVQSYRHVRAKQVEQHKWWSYRLFALVLAALLYRLYIVAYFVVVLFTPWQGSRWVFESLFFLFFIPNLVMVEIYRRSPDSRLFFQSPWLLGSVTLFVGVLTVLNIVYNWWPSIQGVDIGQASNMEHAYDDTSLIH